MTRRIGFGGSSGDRPKPVSQPVPRSAAPTGRDELAGRIAEVRGRARAPRRKSSPWVFLFLLIPLVFEAFGVWMLVDEVRFSGVAQPAMGRVIDIEADSSGDGVAYWPIIEYRTPDGARHEGMTHIGSSGYDYDIGTRLQILYDPANPDEVRIDGFWSRWLLPVAFTTVGTVLFLGLLIGLVKSRQAEDDDEAADA